MSASSGPDGAIAGRKALLSRIDEGINEAKKGWAPAMLAFDLVGFRLINERHGREVGDFVLETLGVRLLQALRSNDLVARFAKDTYYVYLEGFSGQDELRPIESRLRAIIERKIETPSGVIEPEVRSAAVSLQSDFKDGEEVLRAIDSCLAKASSRTKSGPVFFSAAFFKGRAERELADALERAVSQGAFYLVYQPIVDMRSQRALGFEALLRWNDPERGLVPPDSFIPIAEKYGYIWSIGLWVLRESLRALSLLAETLPREGFYFSVNVSAVQLQRPEFLDILVALLVEFKVPPRRLCLEITETALVRHVDTILESLWSIRDMGLGLKLDDLGSGYSSMKYLQRFPVNSLKIDREFIVGLRESSDPPLSANKARSIVRAFVGMGNEMGLEVIAEGVETEADAEALQAIGCKMAQGFLYARGLSDKEIPGFIKTKRGLP
jgi:diguanylate cyclase (GGDEF)-like protein